MRIVYAQTGAEHWHAGTLGRTFLCSLSTLRYSASIAERLKASLLAIPLWV
jgi:hypothetical protein